MPNNASGTNAMMDDNPDWTAQDFSNAQSAGKVVGADAAEALVKAGRDGAE
jgi:hypothetical protein